MADIKKPEHQQNQPKPAQTPQATPKPPEHPPAAAAPPKPEPAAEPKEGTAMALAEQLRKQLSDQSAECDKLAAELAKTKKIADDQRVENQQLSDQLAKAKADHASLDKAAREEVTRLRGDLAKAGAPGSAPTAAAGDFRPWRGRARSKKQRQSAAKG